MPITPRFDVQQSASHVLLRIRVPHIRVSGAELHASGRDLTFHCRPFFLKLTLPHEVLDPSEEEQEQEQDQGEEQKGERSGAVYDPDDEGGVITVRVRKRQPGLHFPGLDLQTRLLQLRKDKDRKEHVFPSIEVLGEQRTPQENGDEENDDEEEEGESEGSSSCAPSLLAKNQNYYGFNSKYTQILTNLREETAEMTSLPDPENMTLASRQQLRQQSEEAAFCPDRYLGDLLGGEEDYIYQQAVGYTAQWEKQWALWKAAKEGSLPPAPGTSDEAIAEADGIMRVEVFDNSGGFSEEEKDTMRSLPNKEYLIAKQSVEERLLMLGLADILFAYCYDHRVTQGESTVRIGVRFLFYVIVAYNCL
jgi:protein SHQ1